MSTNQEDGFIKDPDPATPEELLQLDKSECSEGAQVGRQLVSTETAQMQARSAGDGT